MAHREVAEDKTNAPNHDRTKHLQTPGMVETNWGAHGEMAEAHGEMAEEAA